MQTESNETAAGQMQTDSPGDRGAGMPRRRFLRAGAAAGAAALLAACGGTPGDAATAPTSAGGTAFDGGG